MKALHQISGKVLEGARRGRDLGFPTVNLALTQKIPEGIYAAEVEFNGKIYKAASFAGKAETFGNTESKLESYILDFDDNLYGKGVVVKLYKKIRDNQKFDSAEELIDQMKKDVTSVREFFLSPDRLQIKAGRRQKAGLGLKFCDIKSNQ